MANDHLIVVALGGNAITQEDQEGNVGEQFVNSRGAAGPLADLIEAGHQLVITHGNGPQIGNFLLRNWAAGKVIYPLPMQVAVALVPIECETLRDGAEYLLEVFLEPDCGVATQRGYLRFVAQMADLAGEFLRADQLRQLQRNRMLARDVDKVIAQLHVAGDRKSLEAAIVDGAVELFTMPDISLERGSRTAIIGNNGIGKSTLVRTILGLMPALS
ncbi:MAG: ATP-binding cassette domain-containing protein, partial [Planctomycetes bacterium]|nr:ATP-binding cassette domain-containing protein [Planctomycetota bacterium]